MVNLWGPGAFGAARPAAVRPTFSPSNGAGDPDDWAKDCSSPTARDGTEWRSALLNEIIAQLRGVARNSSVTASNLNPVLLAQAIASGNFTWAVATGTANAWTVAPSLAVPAYAAGRVLWLKAPATNTSTTVNMNVSTLGNRRIKKADGSDPAVGDLASGVWYPTIDDGTNIAIVSTLPSDIVAVQRQAPFFGLDAASATNTIASGVLPATLISSYGSVANSLRNSTFSGGILTIGSDDAGVYIINARLTTNLPKAGNSGTAATYAALLNIDKSTDGGSTWASQASQEVISQSVSVFGPFMSPTAPVRVASGDKIRVSAVQVSTVSLNMPVAFTASFLGK